MAGLDFCSKHNMVAYLEKNDGNTEFHQIMDFLTHSSIHFALTVSPIISTLFVEQFCTSAKSKTVNNISYIDAIIVGKPVTISEASIRSDFLFDDTDGIDTLNNHAIFFTIQLMGPSSSIPITDSNLEGSSGNHGCQSSSDRSLSGNEDGLTLQSVYDLCVSLCKQHVGGKKHSDLKTKNFEEIQVLYEKVKRSDENFIAIGSAEDERLIKDVNKKVTSTKKDDIIKEESKRQEESSRKRKNGTRKDEVKEKKIS
ncbi:hypothetical protein Tco_1131739 [Tanacetum coccineum]|uniref:Uncharacterized protein n=1 Tax=Tanacetum coccineum TaxID=301880 RepID=A0ABQ5JCX7_9ASTR